MLINFNPTGTHLHKGCLKVRFDVYPEPGDKTYELHYVDQFDREPTPEELGDPKLLALVPKHKEITPCLCHFVTISENATKAEISSYLKTIFDEGTIKNLDDVLILPDSAHYVSPLMKPKTAQSALQTQSKAGLEQAINQKLAGLVLSQKASDIGDRVIPESIDVGAGATDRDTVWGQGGRTFLDKNNPANADGTLDTFQLFYNSDGTDVKMGTFSGSATTWDDRDYETLGTVTAGSQQTFTGLNCDVIAGDLIGVYHNAGRIDGTGSGAGLLYSSLGSKFGAGASAYTSYDNFSISIYATGTEAGGEPPAVAPVSGGRLALLGVGR